MRVMIVGASVDPDKYGYKAVAAFQRGGHTVLPVNPNADTLLGLTVYKDVTGPPGPIDRASIYLPPKLAMTVLGPLAARGDVAELWINPGADSPEVLDEARRLGFEPIVACSIVAIGQLP